MKFMVIVKGSANSEAGHMPSARLLTDMGRFNEEMVNAGILLAAEGLHPSSRGVRIHFDGAARSVSAGPFDPPTALVGGYWMIEVASLDEAVAWMRRCPNPNEDGQSEIEIRQVYTGIPPKISAMRCRPRCGSRKSGCASGWREAEEKLAAASVHAARGICYISSH